MNGYMFSHHKTIKMHSMKISFAWVKSPSSSSYSSGSRVPDGTSGFPTGSPMVQAFCIPYCYFIRSTFHQFLFHYSLSGHLGFASTTVPLEQAPLPPPTPRNVRWKWCGPLPKTLTLFMTKIVDFTALFMTWLTIRYYRCGWHSCPKHKLWRTSVDVLIDNDEKVASIDLPRYIPNWRLEC